MRAILPVVAILTLASASAQGKEIVFEIGPDSMLSATFGLEPFKVGRFCDFFSSSPPNVTLDSCSFQLTSGLLLDLTEDGSINETVYSYGAGTVLMTVSAETAQGKVLEGTFAGTTHPFELFICEGCDDLFGGSLADDLDILFDGVIDDGFAKIVGASDPFVTGSFEIGLEDIDGDPTSAVRKGFSSSGNGRLFMNVEETIPEPSLLMLGLTSAGMCIARRRRTRRRAHA